MNTSAQVGPVPDRLGTAGTADASPTSPTCPRLCPPNRGTGGAGPVRNAEPAYWGGPLDGQPARLVRGKLGTFRTETGAALATKAGDALLHRLVPVPERRAYVLADDAQPLTYVWIPAWAEWRRTPAGASS